MLEPDLMAKVPNPPDVHSGSWRSAVDFFVQFGTHLVSNYTAGDGLFQVLVFNTSSSAPAASPGAKQLAELRQRVDQFNPANASISAWTDLLVGRTPPAHIGKLQVPRPSPSAALFESCSLTVKSCKSFSAR